MIVVSLVLSILFSIFSCILRFFADLRLRQEAVAGFFIKNSCAHRARRIVLLPSATIVPQECSCGDVEIAELRGFPRRSGWERPPFPGSNIKRFPALMRDWRMQLGAAREKRVQAIRRPRAARMVFGACPAVVIAPSVSLSRCPLSCAAFPGGDPSSRIPLSAIDRVCPFPGGSCCFC